MLFDDVILGRRSIRGYKPDPVPRKLIEEIIGLAMIPLAWGLTYWMRFKSGLILEKKKMKNEPNKAMQPTPMLVTDRAYARSAPSIGAADLGR